jgi:hypothetical protein
MTLENGNQPAEPTLSEADRADMDVFLHNILEILPVLGIQAFEHSPTVKGHHNTTLLTCQGKGVKANGHDTPQGFIVREGSFAVVDEVPSLRNNFPNVSRLREELLKNGVLTKDTNRYKFVQDFTFNSPSLAAAIVLGRASNGRIDWKDATGRTLKEIQQAQAKS